MPSQFVAQQEALLRAMGVRGRLGGAPYHGVARLSWDEELQRQGALSLSALTVIFPGGELIDIPGNAVVNTLPFGETEENWVEVYAHLLAETVEVTDDDEAGGGGDDTRITRVVHQLELSTSPGRSGARKSLKLARFDRHVDGTWRLGVYVPPLLQIGTSPFLRDILRADQELLQRLDIDFARQMRDPFLGGEHVERLQRGSAAAYRLRSLLVDISGQIRPHPYDLFCALRDFYAEVCLLEKHAVAEPIPYDHEDIRGCF
ncbi:MAG: type VI secretion system baseplate subunit TssK, partial [Myxococcota bacterium]